ncbi:MAG TPA: fumarylacetoacetate hydrolase family protein [Miltoncostaeaceae bacterium]|nr:fumarylacetoacetate hydrolase family protein [Miltoncostaeaceae bacterium]
MKLCTFLGPDGPTAGRVQDDAVTPLRATGLGEIVRGATVEPAGGARPLAGLTLLPPLRPVKLLAVARNYAEHAAELGERVPEVPQIFSKLVTSVTGPAGPVVHPDWTDELDYEGELAVVIGRTARDVPEEQALGHVFGYTVVNDVSARDRQRTEPQWTRAKGGDTFCPMGPWVVTADEIPDPQSLTVRTWVNGELRQDGRTADMFFPVARVVSWCSRSFTLEPGDVICTGTPAGVGRGFDPPRYLRRGDVVRIEVGRVGVIEHPVR